MELEVYIRQWALVNFEVTELYNTRPARLLTYTQEKGFRVYDGRGGAKPHSGTTQKAGLTLSVLA